MNDYLVSANDIIKAYPRLKYFGGVTLVNFFLWITRISKLNKLYKNCYHLPSSEFVDHSTKLLGLKYDLLTEDLNNIPGNGAFILIGNHPLGGAESLLSLKIIKDIRPDIKYMANFIMNQVGPLEPYFIPVNPFETMRHLRSSYKGLKLSAQHLEQGNALCIFPAGEVSSYQKKRREITDKEWPPSIMKFIKSQNVTVLPIYFSGKNSKLFYLLGKIHPLLRTVKLVSELFNKKNQIIKIKIGKPISAEEQLKHHDIQGYTRFLRDSVYSMK